MKLYVKNSYVSLKGSSYVKDESGEDVFKVQGKLVSITKVKTVKDMNGEKLYKIRNKMFRFIKDGAYVKDANNKKVFFIKEKNCIINKGYVVKGGDADYDIEWGGVASGINRLYRDGEVVLTIKRKILNITDTFEIEFDDKEDAGLMVAITIALDNIQDKD